ncbi:hypothetical protein V6O07_10335 [Arthrospira platensis SPKY2]
MLKKILSPFTKNSLLSTFILFGFFYVTFPNNNTPIRCLSGRGPSLNTGFIFYYSTNQHLICSNTMNPNDFPSIESNQLSLDNQKRLRDMIGNIN